MPGQDDERNFLEPPLAKTRDFCALSFLFWLNDSVLRNLHYYESFNGSDRTITWRAWKEVAGGAFRMRTGDRYLGGQKWEHYLCFEQRPEQAKAIKLSMIHLASESVEDVLLCPGWRYAILKVTNNTMTARKGVWSWTAHEVSKDDATQSKTRLKHPLEMYEVARR